MTVPKRRLVLAAQRICDQLQAQKEARYREISQRLTHFIDRVEQLRGIRRKLSICKARGWDSAAAKTVKNAENTLHELPYLLPEIERAAKSCETKVPSIRDIYQDLIQSAEEFGELHYSTEDDVISVTTEPIELEGVHLGDFEIQLHLSQLAETHDSAAFKIVALDPHPAAANESVTHPHVSEERLCPGNGEASIRMALSSGRICDFLTMVRSILTTYNQESPYVSLAEWDGRQCGECGIWVSTEESYYCHSCELDLCGDCAPCCHLCEETNCLSCLQTCPQCEELVCRGCIKECPDCGDTMCSECADEGECPCSETDKEEESYEQEQEKVTDSCGDQEEDSRIGNQGNTPARTPSIVSR